jgi:hypothetical protein
MSVVGNGGFESALINDDTVPQPLTYGNWIAHQSYGSIYRPSRVGTDPHEGSYCCRIQATNGTGSGGWVLQDFTEAQVDPLQGFYFSAWVKPIQGNEQMTLVFDYDRGPGTSAGSVTVDMWSDHTDCLFLGQANPVAPAVPFNGAWHNVAMRGWPDLTTDWIIDDVVRWTSPPGTLPSYSIASIILGEGTGLAHPRVDDFYWDEVSLDFNPFPSGGSNVPLRQRQSLMTKPRMRQQLR